MNTTLAAMLISGILLGGCATPVAGPEATPTGGAVVPTATAAPPTPVPTYTVSGTVFFDYNGDGLRDEGEPPIEGVPIRVAGLSTTSGPDGRYSLAGVPAGRQRVQVESPTQETATAFRYMSSSVKAFQSIDEPIIVQVADDAELDVALMQGFLTLPLTCEAPLSEPPCWVDLDFGPGVTDWQGGSRTCRDNHYGIDYVTPAGQAVVAAAPGFIVEAEVGWPNVPRDPDLGLWDDGNRITIYHGYGVYSIYAHLGDRFFVQARPLTRCCMEFEQVSRGQILALSGNTGALTEGPHLHFQIDEGGIGWDRRVDPYRDLQDPRSGSLWTKDNDPQCLP